MPLPLPFGRGEGWGEGSAADSVADFTDRVQSHLLPFRLAPGPSVRRGWDVFETHDVKRIQDDGITPPIGDHHGAWRQQEELRVRHRIFIAAGRCDGKRAKSILEAGADELDVHA